MVTASFLGGLKFIFALGIDPAARTSLCNLAEKALQFRHPVESSCCARTDMILLDPARRRGCDGIGRIAAPRRPLRWDLCSVRRRDGGLVSRKRLCPGMWAEAVCWGPRPYEGLSLAALGNLVDRCHPVTFGEARSAPGQGSDALILFTGPSSLPAAFATQDVSK